MVADDMACNPRNPRPGMHLICSLQFLIAGKFTFLLFNDLVKYLRVFFSTLKFTFGFTHLMKTEINSHAKIHKSTA